MGEQADYARDEEEYERFIRPSPCDVRLGQGEPPIWTQANGQEISVTDMGTSHVKNALRLCKRNARQMSEEISAAYSVSATFRGEMAILYADRDIARLEEYESQIHGWIKVFKAELACRKVILSQGGLL